MTDRSNYSLRFNRTMPLTRDASNWNLRFHRTRRSAGILGPLAPVETDTLSGWAKAMAAAVAAGFVVFAALVVLFSVQP